MRSLCRIWKPSWQGMVMAELSYTAGKGPSTEPCEISVKEGRLIRLRACCPESGASMTLLLLPQKEGKVKKERAGVLWRTFSAAEVREFSHSLGDHNEIHQGAAPIVSGFQLAAALDEDFSFGSGRIRFHAPVRAGEPIYIEKTADGCVGYTEERCFVYEK